MNRYPTSGTMKWTMFLVCMVIIALTFVLLLTAQAANKFIKPGGTGNGDSWSAAGGTNLVNSCGPGDVAWLAGGNYGNGFAITVSGNAASPIVIKRATASDHGSDAGWNASYDAQAVFNTGLGISGSYIFLDGNTWSPPGMPKTFGILVHHGSTGQKGIDAGGSPGHLIIRNVAVQGGGINASTKESDGCHIPSNTTISGSSVSNTDALIFAWKGTHDVLVEYSYLYNASSNIVLSGNPQDPHPDVIYSGGMFTDSTVRYCVVANVTSEGMFFDQELPGQNFTVTGCIEFEGASQNGNTPHQWQNGAKFGDVQFAFNTQVDFAKSNVLGPGTSLGSGSTVTNNLFINYLPNWATGVSNNGFSSTGVGAGQIIDPKSPFVTSGPFVWVKGSNNPPAATRTSGAPVGYSPLGMEQAFVLADNSWAKGRATKTFTDMWGNTSNNLGAIQGPPSGGSGPGPSPTATPAPSATPTPPPVGNKFAPGDGVTPTAVLNVRATPSGVVLGQHHPGDIGVVVSGPVHEPLKQDVAWYMIGWDTAPQEGYSGDDDLVKTALPQPTPTPTPSPTPPPQPTPTPSQTWEKWIEKQNTWIRQNPPTPDK